MENPSSPFGPDDDTGTRVCRACGHDEQAHDPTALRFCRASLEHALDRACVCGAPKPPAPSAHPMYGRGRFSGR